MVIISSENDDIWGQNRQVYYLARRLYRNSFFQQGLIADIFNGVQDIGGFGSSREYLYIMQHMLK